MRRTCTHYEPEWNDQERRIVLWGLGTYLGWGERQDKVGNLIHEVRNTNMKMILNHKRNEMKNTAEPFRNHKSNEHF